MLFWITTLFPLVVGVDVSTTLNIVWPSELANQFDNGVPATPALFGNTAFGESKIVQGNVFYMHPSENPFLCNPLSDEDIAEIPETFEHVIYLIDRGGCHFASKVRNVQNAGGSGVIILNNNADEHLFYMANDNTGDNIGIPSVFVSRSSGNTLKEYIAKDAVTVTLSWGLPLPGNKVAMDFFTTAVDKDRGQQALFKKHFAEVAKILGPALVLSPHFAFMDGRGPPYNTFDPDPVTRKDLLGQCTNQGRYCNMDPSPDKSMTDKWTGAQVVQEHLRQLCLFQVINDTTKDFQPWWDYVVRFDAECNQDPGWDWSGNCSYRLLDDIQPGFSDKVKQDIVASGGSGMESGANSLIDASLLAIEDWNIYEFPTVYLNQYKILESFQCTTDGNQFDKSNCGVLMMLCEALTDPPPICRANGQCSIGLIKDDCGLCGGDCIRCGVDKCGECMPTNSSQWNVACAPTPPPTLRPTRKTKTTVVETVSEPFPTYGVILIVLGCLALVGGLVAIYLRRRETYMRNDIDDLLQQYLPMEGAARSDAPINRNKNSVHLHANTEDTESIRLAINGQ